MTTTDHLPGARIGFLLLTLAPAATPQVHMQPATEHADQLICVQFTSEVVVALSVEQAAALRGELDRVLLAVDLAAEISA